MKLRFSFRLFSNESRIVNSGAGMILKSQLILTLNYFYFGSSGNTEHLFRGVVILSCYLIDGGKWQRTEQNPACGVFFNKENKMNLRQYCISPTPQIVD